MWHGDSRRSHVDAKISGCGIHSCVYCWLPEEMQQEDVHACFGLLNHGRGEEKRKVTPDLYKVSIYHIIIYLDGDMFLFFVLADDIPLMN